MDAEPGGEPRQKGVVKLANELKCANCGFFWQEEGENHPYCHWEVRCPDDKAPCEYDDDDYVEEPDCPDEW